LIFFQLILKETIAEIEKAFEEASKLDEEEGGDDDVDDNEEDDSGSRGSSSNNSDGGHGDGEEGSSK
jgi:hypothetical protein